MSSPIKNRGATTPSLRRGIFLAEFVHTNCRRHDREMDDLGPCRGVDAIDLYEIYNLSQEIQAAADAEKAKQQQQQQHERQDSSSTSISTNDSNVAGDYVPKYIKVTSTKHGNDQQQQQQRKREEEGEDPEPAWAMERLLHEAAQSHFRDNHPTEDSPGPTVEVREARVVWKDLGPGMMDLLEVPQVAAERQLDLVRARGYADHIRIHYATRELGVIDRADAWEGSSLTQHVDELVLAELE